MVPGRALDVWIMRLIWFAPSELYPGKRVWNSATPLAADVKAPLRKVLPYSPRALAEEVEDKLENFVIRPTAYLQDQTLTITFGIG